LFVQRAPVVDGSIKGWLAAIDVLAGMKVRHVIPGHGGVSQDLEAALAPERHYLQFLLENVRQQIALGKPLQQAIKEIDYPQKARWLLFDAAHAHNIARAYQELEWE
jgi:hypothetical protein